MSGSFDQTIRLWDARTHREWPTLDVGTALTSVALNADVGIVTGLATGLLSLELREAEGCPCSKTYPVWESVCR